MEINKHIAFYYKEEPELVQYLQNNNIHFDEGEIITSFDIYESNQHWAWIEQYIKKREIICISDTVFTKKELQNADWMEIRSIWHYEYPQPVNDYAYRTVTYTNENYCPKCGQGLDQINPFRIKKSPKWGKRHFLMLNWVTDELFVDEYAKKLIEKEFSFLSFCEVKDKSGTKILENIFQIILPVLSEEGIIEEQRYIRESLECSNCGRKKYHPNGEAMLQFRKHIFENAPDIVKTSELFGWGSGADRKIIISQKMYQFIVSNRLERCLYFSPIDLID